MNIIRKGGRRNGISLRSVNEVLGKKKSNNYQSITNPKLFFGGLVLCFSFLLCDIRISDKDGVHIHPFKVPI